ncbi:MAG: autotransporter outer membrane beta-barrel domain-containing protein [Anaerobiospirillum sp.]|nr:autotransporter outer membrane beta-barrel domain-containing protein [Anaerobiospirillum sp.]
MKQTNHALTFLLAHYRAIFSRALRSSSAWTGVATVALTSAVAATPMVPPTSIAAQPVVETTSDAVSKKSEASAECSAYIQVEPGSPVVHVPTFAPRPYGFDSEVPAKFFDLAQDGSPLSHDRDLNANVLSSGYWSASLPGSTSVFAALARDAAQAQWGVPAVSDATAGAGAAQFSVTQKSQDAMSSAAGSAATNAAVTTVNVGADGTITLTDSQGAVMTLRPSTAQEHHYSVVTGAYELKIQPDTTVELIAGSSLSLDGVTRAISVEADGTLALDSKALSAYDLSLGDELAANLVVDVSALGELDEPGILKLGHSASSFEPTLPEPKVATSVHDYQFPEQVPPQVSTLLPQDTELSAQNKLSFASAANLNHGLTVAQMPGSVVDFKVQELTSPQLSAADPFVLSSAQRATSAPAVLDLGSLNAHNQGSSDAFAVDLVMDTGPTLVVTDHSPATPNLLTSRALPSVFAAPGEQNRRVDLEVADDTNHDYLALTYRSAGAQPVTSSVDSVKFVLAQNTTVMLDVSSLGEDTVAITQDTKRPAVVLTRDDHTGLLAINGADIALPLNGSGRVDVSDLLEARARGLSSEPQHTPASDPVLTGIASGDQLAGSWQALEAEPDTKQVTVSAGQTLDLTGTLPHSGSLPQSGSLPLSGGLPQHDQGLVPQDENLAPIAATSQGQMVGIELGAGSTLNLKSSGKVGSLTGKGTVNLNGVELMVVSPDGLAPADVEVESLKLKDSALKAKEIQAKHFESLSSALHLESLQVSDEGSFSVRDSKLKLKHLDLSRVAETAQVAASEVEVDTVVAHQMALHQGTSVYADTIKLSGINSVLAVGHQQVELPEPSVLQDSSAPQKPSASQEPRALHEPSAPQAPALKLSTTSPVVTNVVTQDLDLQGGLLWLAAPEGERATVQTTNLGASTLKLSGNVVVGPNAALGVTQDAAGFAQAQARVMADDALLKAQDANAQADAVNATKPQLNLLSGSESAKVSSLAYIDRAGIEMGPYKLIVGPENQQVLQRELNGSNSVYLGPRGGLQVTARALAAAAERGSVFVDMSGKTVASNGGYLLVPAMTNAQELGTIFGSEVKLKDGDRINVATENGLYRGTITNSAQLQGKLNLDFKLAPNSRQILRKLSDPTYDALMNIMSPDSSFIGTYERSQMGSLDSIVNDQSTNDSSGISDLVTGDPNGTTNGGLTNNTIPGDSNAIIDGANDALPPSNDGSLANDSTSTDSTTTSGNTTNGAVVTTPSNGGLDNSLANSTISDSLTSTDSTTDSTTGTQTGTDSGDLAAVGDLDSGAGSAGGSSGSSSSDISNSLRPSNGVKVQVRSAGFQFLRDALGSNNYEAIDQVARMANFGGAVQGVQLVSASSVDAMNLRLGFGKGANMELTSGIARASSLERNSLWLNPIYRNYKAKDYDAQGREYGSDIELYGAILGLDHYEDGSSRLLSGTGLEGLRFGAMFSVGEGEAEGKNAGQGINNDMSFYSVGVFAGLDLGRDVKLVANLSYAEVDNDLSALAGVADWNMMTSSTDSSNWNVGVGAQVTLQALKSKVEITPHLSLRYHRVALDDYEVAIDGTTVAANSMQDMNMWSVPLGVSFARDFITDQWQLRPAFDLTISANFGDTDMYSRTRFDGVSGADFNYCTQVIDNFTYSVTTGVALKHNSGKFSAVLNVGYNGSLHAEDYMVNGQLNYLF